LRCFNVTMSIDTAISFFDGALSGPMIEGMNMTSVVIDNNGGISFKAAGDGDFGRSREVTAVISFMRELIKFCDRRSVRALGQKISPILESAILDTNVTARMILTDAKLAIGHYRDELLANGPRPAPSVRPAPLPGSLSPVLDGEAGGINFKVDGFSVTTQGQGADISAKGLGNVRGLIFVVDEKVPAQLL